MRELKKGSEKLKTSTTRAKGKDWLYFIPLLAILLGLVFIWIDETANFPWDQSNPPANLGYWFWTGGLFLIVVGILGGLLALGLYLWRARAAKLPR